MASTRSLLDLLRRWRRVDPIPLLFLLPAGWILHPALQPGWVVGTHLGEAWSHMFDAAQVRRWLTLLAPPGRADLVGYPEGMPFWPVDPALLLLQAPLGAVVGDPLALAAIFLLLLFAAGAGPYLLARTAGASRAGAFAAGAAVQLAPFLLQHLRGSLLEMGAVGVLALAARACLLAVREGGTRRAAVAGLWILALAGTSPYFTVYLALGCALALPASLRAWRRWIVLGVAGVVACAVAVTPYVAFESGSGGRLGPTWGEGGYTAAPGAYTLLPAASPPVSGETVAPSLGGPSGPPEGGGPPPRAGPIHSQLWMRTVQRAPGGATLLLALVIGAILPGGRRWALLGVVFFATGPGLPLLIRQFGISMHLEAAPLVRLLAGLPIVGSMGNARRLLVGFILPAAIGGGLACSRWRPAAIVLAGLAFAEAGLTVRPLLMPTFASDWEPAVLAALDGPTVVFPSGDSPCWHPSVGPREAAFLASRAGVPIAADLGRGVPPSDLRYQVGLSAMGSIPIGLQALDALRRPEGVSPAPFGCLLVLEDRLQVPERTRLLSWLEAHARPLVRGRCSSAWRIPEGGWSFPGIEHEGWMIARRKPPSRFQTH